MNNSGKSYFNLSVLTLACLINTSANANTILDFENPLPNGLTSVGFNQGTAVQSSNLVTDQFLSEGVLISGAALSNFGSGHAASGTNVLAPVGVSNTIDYNSSVSFSFFLNNTAAETNFFSYAPDLAGFSGNIITLYAYSLAGSLIAEATYPETNVFNQSTQPRLSGIGYFHKVVIDVATPESGIGGIGIDLIEYGDLRTSSVPLPASAPLFLSGFGIIGLISKRRKTQ